MRSRSNRWYDAICLHLREAGGPLLVEQIWQRMEASGFRHASESPKSTLGARIAELVQLKKLDHVAPKTYRLREEAAA